MMINVVMSYLIGGAYIGLLRIAKKLPQYTWTFTTEVDQKADIVIYMNDNKHYERAKKLGVKHIIQRKTGERSLAVPTPDDLASVICGSKKSFNYTKHAKKVLIYNGVDLDYIKTINPKPNVDLLVGEQRLGKGQRVDLAIKWATTHGRHLTCLGSGEGLAEDTYAHLKRNHPQVNWVGRVSEEEALSYIKGCSAIIISNPSHGVPNQGLEALSMDKEIINLAGVEIPNKEDIDLNKTADKYNQLIEEILNGRS